VLIEKAADLPLYRPTVKQLVEAESFYGAQISQKADINPEEETRCEHVSVEEQNGCLPLLFIPRSLGLH
jgi:hypothetical protein